MKKAEFKFISFNAVRAFRGAKAARVIVIEKNDETWLWMNAEDIKNNLCNFGSHPELVKAQEAYRGYE